MQKMTKIMTFGTFDLFHEGHKAYLRQAKEFGDSLIVVVARDYNVHRIKGFYPEDSENTRKESVEQCGLADEVVLGNKENMFEVLDRFKPDVLCLGYDQSSHKVETYIREHNLQIEIKRMNPFKEEIYKSSRFRKKNL